MTGRKARSGRPRSPRTVAQERDAAFVRSIADAIVLKDRDLFLLTDSDGSVPEVPDHGLGLYLHDCRLLDVYELRIGGERLEAGATDASPGDRLTLELANVAGLDLDGRQIGRHRLTVHCRRVIDGRRGQVFDELVIANTGPDVARVALSLATDSRFEDVFEVRGLKRPRPGTVSRAIVDPSTWRLTYAGGGGFVRSVWFQADPAPSQLVEGRATWQLEVPAEDQRRLALTLSAVESSRVPATPPGDGASGVPAPRRQARDGAAWFGNGTVVRSGDPVFGHIMQRSLADLRLLLSSDGRNAYVAAGLPWFACLFGRDSLVTAYQLLAYDTSVAAATLRLLARRQGKIVDGYREEQPGRILHELRRGEYAHLGLIPHTPYFGTVDATPLWLCLLGRYVDWTGDMALYRSLRPSVEAALAWMDGDGRASGGAYLEYGPGTLANQGWKDSGDAIFGADGVLARPPIQLAEVQGYDYRARLAVAELLERDGERDPAERLRTRAETLRRTFARDFWSASRGVYGIARADDRLLEVVSSNAGQVLWSGLPSAARARRIAQVMLEPASFSGWGVRTLAEGEPRYDPLGYHLGTVWPHDNAFIVEGLRGYGLDDAAERIVTGLYEAAVEFPGRRLPELFAGYDRADFEAPVPYPVACHPQAWAAGAMPAMLTSMLGLEPDGTAGRLTLRRPRLPVWLPSLELDGLRVGRGRVDLRFAREPAGRTSVEVRRSNGVEVLVSS